MPHLDPLPCEANAQPCERFGHCQDTRGFVPNGLPTNMTTPVPIHQASNAKIRVVWAFETSTLFTPAERAVAAVGWSMGKHGS